MSLGSVTRALVTFGYDANEQRTSIPRSITGTAMEPKINSTLTYDPADRLTSITHVSQISVRKK